VSTPRRALIAVLAALIAAFIVLSIVSSAGKLPAVDLRPRAGWLALALVLLGVGQAMHAALWRRIVLSAGGALGVLDAVSIFSTSLLARYVPTQVLMAVTRVTMAERVGVARSVSLTAIVYEFALVVATSIALSLAYLLSLDRLAGSPLQVLVVLVPFVVLAALHPRVVDALSVRLATRLDLDPEHRSVPTPALAALICGYLLSFVVFGAAVLAFAEGLGPIQTPDLPALSAYAVGYAASVLAFFIPGGLGAREAAMASALTTIMPLSFALTVAIGVRIAQTGVELAFAGVAALLVRRRGRAAAVGVDPC